VRGATEEAIDELFRLAPPEFTAARNELATGLRKEGRTDAAKIVRALTKPSVSAWTVNQLFWRHRAAFERLIAAGERLRQVQASHLAGRPANVRAPLGEVREALSELTRLGAQILHTSSGRAPAGVMRRVTVTLEALSSYGTLPDAPRAGRLVDDVDPPGFETLAALVPRVGDTSRGDAPSKVLRFQQESPRKSPAGRKPARGNERRDEAQRQARFRAADRARQTAVRGLAAARKEARRAQTALKSAATRAKESERDMVQAEQRLQKVAERAHEMRQGARRAAVDAENAAQAVEEAERALEQTTRDLEALRTRPRDASRGRKPSRS
jgi:hypothetical protein